MTNPDWPRLLTQYWSVRWLATPADVDAAAGEVRAFFGRNAPDNDELCDVLRWMAGPEGRQEKAPTLRQIIRAICIRRKARNDERRGYRPDDPDGFLGRVKSAMLRASDNKARWDAMVAPREVLGAERDTTCAECRVIEAWATARWPDFAEEVMEERDKLVQTLRECRELIDQGRLDTVRSVAQCPTGKEG